MDYRFKAPFPYFGGKSEIADVIWSRLGDTSNYVEGFFGSGAVLLNRPHWQPKKTMLETVNDASGFIANFWRAVRAAPDEVAYHADNPVNECVPAGTMIATPDGEIPVEDIRPGMIVLGDKDGETIPTKVIATKQSEADEFYRIGPLLLTENHPIWTQELGYIEARDLRGTVHIKSLRWPVCENDIIVLQCPHEQEQNLGDLHTERPSYQSGTLCWRDIPKKGPLQRTSISRHYWRQNLSGLLDSLIDCGWCQAVVSSNRVRNGGRLARSGEALDRPLQAADQVNQFDRGGRWRARLCSNARATAKMVRDACWGSLCSWSHSGHEGQKTHAGSYRKDPKRQRRQENARQYETKIVRSAQTKSDLARTADADDRSQQRNEANGRIQTESNCVSRAPKQADSLYRNRRNLSVHQGGGSCYRRKQGRDSVRTESRYTLQRLHIPTPVAVYNFQTTTGNYYANRILVHNCDLHARHAGEALQRKVVAAEGAAIAAVVIIGVCLRLRLGVFLRITCSLVR